MTTEVTQAALEPCPNPWCNSRKTVDCEIRAAEAPILMPSRSSPEWAVACPVCPLQTPYFDTEAEAITAWNTRLTAQSGEGRSGAGSHNVDANGKPTDDSDPWFQLGWYKDRLERAETERDIWKERAMSLRIASRSTALQTALEDICDPIAALRRYADERGRQLDGAVAFQLANDPNHIKGIARAALNARQSGEGEREALREALAEAYRKGATDVHNYWVNNPGEPPRGDPEFGESASDYAAAALDIFDSAAALRATDDAGGA